MGIRERLGIPKHGNWLGIVKFDCLAGRFWRVDKDQLGQQVLIDLLGKPVAIDCGTMEYGWMRFGPTGPVRYMVPNGSPPPAKPDEVGPDGKDLFKAGFYGLVCGQAVEGAREWCSTTEAVVNVIDNFQEQYEAAPEAARGQIPLVVITASAPVVKGAGARRQTTYSPVITITGWVDRPATLGQRTVPLPTPTSVTSGTAATPQVQADRTVPMQQVAQPATPASLPADVMPF